MSDKSSKSESTSNDTDSSVIFVGVSNTIKIEAEIHANDQNSSTESVQIVPEAPNKDLTDGRIPGKHMCYFSTKS